MALWLEVFARASSSATETTLVELLTRRLFCNACADPVAQVTDVAANVLSVRAHLDARLLVDDLSAAPSETVDKRFAFADAAVVLVGRCFGDTAAAAAAVVTSVVEDADKDADVVVSAGIRLLLCNLIIVLLLLLL